MTHDEMHKALVVGADWQAIWSGADPSDTVEHLCTGLYSPGGDVQERRARLRYAVTACPGIEVARCGRCRIAWVRAVGG